MRHAVQALTSALALAILVGIALGYGGAFVFALDGLAHFRLHFLAAIPPIACVALWVRNWRGLFRCGVAALLAIAGLGAMVERPSPVPVTDGEARTITVMTANLYQQNPQPERMRAAIRSADPDILVTNETSRNAMEGPTSLAEHYPHQVMLGTRGRFLRTVIWSKFPIREEGLMLEDMVEPTGARAVISLSDDFEIGVIGLHFAHAAIGNQDVQIEALRAIAQTLPETRVVMGDLNLTPWSWAMLRTEELTGTRRIPGYRVTWYGRYSTPFGPLGALIGQPIDHVLTSPGLTVEEVRTVAIPGSDHLGVFARLRLPPGAGVSLSADAPYVLRQQGGRDAVGYSRDRTAGRDAGEPLRRLSLDFRDAIPGRGSDDPGIERARPGWPAAVLP